MKEGEITKMNDNPKTKLELKLSKISTNGSTETKTKKCKTTPSNKLSTMLEYGLKIRWIKAIITQAAMSKYRKIKSLDELAVIIVIITSRLIM